MVECSFDEMESEKCAIFVLLVSTFDTQYSQPKTNSCDMMCEQELKARKRLDNCQCGI